MPDHVVELARRAGSRPDDSIALARGEHPLETQRSVAANPIVRYIADALRFYMEFHLRYDGFYGAFIHDPLALAAALDPSLVTAQPVHVDVDTAGGLADGQTIADWRGLTGKPANVDVAVSADAAAFLAASWTGSEGWRAPVERGTLTPEGVATGACPASAEPVVQGGCGP